MAFDTFSLGYMTVPLNHTEMAFLTGDPPGDILSVIEVPALDLNIPFRLDMAGGAPSDGTRNALLLPFWPRLIIVTDEAVDFVNREVFSLNKLSMAACTTKLHPPS
jgi:hypothetical protein